jgi:autoinducer 2 (AI-2) kinase
VTGRFVLGLDFGGGGVRCLGLDLDSGRWHCEHRAVRPIAAPGLGGLGQDLDVPALDTALADAVRSTLARLEASAADVGAVACTSQRHSTVVLDAEGELLLATPNRDARAAGEGLRLAAEHGAGLHAMSGHWPLPIFTAARLQWLRDQRPELFERADRVLAASEWLAWRLCGVAAADPTHAGESLLFELEGRCWSKEWIERLGLPAALLPEPVEAGTPLGTLSDDAAAWLGLAAGATVAAGVADTQSGLVGCGALEPGELAAIAGTTTPVQRVLGAPFVDPEARVWTGQHAPRATRVLESNAGAMGDDLTAFASLLHPEHTNPIVRLMADAAAGPAGAAGAVSTVGADVMHARRQGLPYASLGFSPMALPPGAEGRAVLSRALVEGVACALHANAEQLASLLGEPAAGVLKLSGGLSRSPTFCQIAANVRGEAIEVAGCSEASALGAALCAAVGAGAFDDLAEAARALLPASRRVEPDPAAAAASSDAYEAWQAARSARAEADAQAAMRAAGAAMGRAASQTAPPTSDRRPRILATAQLDAPAVERLGQLGELTYASYRDAGRMLKDDALADAAAGFEILITEIDVVGADAMARLPELRVIASCRGDAVNVDVAAASLHGIPVLNTPGRNADAVADLTVAFLLMLARKLEAASGFLRATEHEAGELRVFGMAYTKFRGRELWRSTIGLVGLGAVGRQVAARLSGFGARVLASDPFVDAEAGSRAGVEMVPLDELLERSDYVSLHAPVTDGTRGLIGEAAIAAMKPGAALVNTARAALVDEAALVAALAEGRLAAAALDVFSVEPPGSDHPLLQLDNVIATPHMGGNTREVSAHQGEIVVDDLARLLRGDAPHHALNRDVLDVFDWDQPRPVPSAEALEALRDAPGPAVTDLERDSSS